MTFLVFDSFFFPFLIEHCIFWPLCLPGLFVFYFWMPGTVDLALLGAGYLCVTRNLLKLCSGMQFIPGEQCGSPGSCLEDFFRWKQSNV